LEATLKSRQVVLRPFDIAHITPQYLTWLNDPDVNRYSRRFGLTTSEDDARRYIASLAPREVILCIETPDHGHVGNIKYGPVDLSNSRADISILIGERRVWGQGLATAAIYLVARHLFLELGLNRLEAGSANPAFLRVVAKLGWRIEGVQRSRVRVGDRLLDWTLVGQLRDEFVNFPALDPVLPQTNAATAR
jgi:[ribosomal protein S5]-alanine N-acetyltransferase